MRWFGKDLKAHFPWAGNPPVPKPIPDALIKPHPDGFNPPLHGLKFTCGQEQGSGSDWGGTRNIGQNLISPAVQDTAPGEREWDPFPVFYEWVINPTKTAFRDEKAAPVLSVVTAMARVSIELALSSQEHLNKTRGKHTDYLWGNKSNTFSRLWIKLHSLQKKSWRKEGKLKNRK